MSNEWYIKINNVEHGPLSSDKLKQLAQQGKVTPDTPLKNGESIGWVTASHVKGLFPMAASAGTPATAKASPPRPASSASNPTPKPPSAIPPALPQRAASSPASVRWYVCENGKTFGPHSNDELKEMAREGTVGPAAQVKEGEHGRLMLVSQVPGIAFPTAREQQALSTEFVPRAKPETVSRPCPFCGETILVVAKKCKHCGEFLDQGSVAVTKPKTSGKGMPSSGNEELRQIASYQRGVIFCLLFEIPAYVGVVALPPPLNIVPVLVLLIVAIVGVVFVFRIAIRVYSAVAGIFLGILTFVPCLGLIVLLIINQGATKRLTENGIKVGLFGASMSQF
ncbi:MAG: GYF domain-containing protein [Planctomycetota bacterium]